MRIAVVGAGAAGISLSDALIRLNPVIPLEITIYDPIQPMGPGRPYREDTEAALLNQGAPLMSIRDDDPEHFVRWIAGHIDPEIRKYSSKGDFLPRALFGLYLRESLVNLVQMAEYSGHNINFSAREVIGINTSDTGYSVRVLDGVRLYDAIVLCLGTPPPADVFGIADIPGCISDPYPLRESLSSLSTNSTVTICGTGLTAIDVFLALRERGHRGAITLASRRGYLPSVRSPGLNPRPRLMSETELLRRTSAGSHISLADVVSLALDELKEFGITPEAVTQELRHFTDEPATRLERHLKRSAEGAFWHAVLINGINEIVELAWSRFNDDERRTFLAEHHAKFMTLFSPIPPATGGKIADAMASGQLSVHSGLSAVRPEHSGGFTVTTSRGDHFANVVVNAARHPTACPAGPAQILVQSLIEGGLGRRHPFGGLDVDVSTYQLRAPSGETRPGLHVIGQLTAGASYYTSSLYIISRCAAKVAENILTQQGEI